MASVSCYPLRTQARRSRVVECIGASALFFLVQVPLPAQNVAVSENSETEDDTVVLSPFEVDGTADVGYRVTNTTSGTSLNTPIKELPMAIQVVTEEFMTDIGATDLDEALAYSAGVFTDTQEAPGGTNSAGANEGGGSNEKSVSASARGNRFANVVTIRGFDVPFQTRLGFRVGGIVVTPTTNIALGGLLDSLNMDRLEVVKGPNSLLYGIGVLSGIVNAIPKKPSAVSKYELSVTGGDYGFLRGTVDATGPVVKAGDHGHSLNLRVAGVWEKRDHWTGWQTKSQRYNLAQLNYRFKDKVDAFLEYQTSWTKFNGTGDQWVYDDGGGSDPFFLNEWDERHNFAREVGPIQGSGQVDRRVITTDAAGRPLRTPRVELFYTEPNPANRQLQGGGLSDTYRITGPDTYEQRDEDNLLLNIDLTPTRNLAFSAGAYYTKQDTEALELNVLNRNNSASGSTGNVANFRNTLSAIGETEFTVDDVWSIANPFFIARDRLNPADVNPFDGVKLTRYWWSKRPTSSDSFQWRVRGTYSFDAKLPLIGDSSHTFLVGNHFINDSVRFLNGQEAEVRAYNRDTSLNDSLYFRPIDDYSVFRYNDENLAMPGLRYSEQDIWFKGYYGVYQGKFWNEKLGAIIGLRYDEYNASTADYIRLSPERTAGLTKEQIQAQEVGYVDNPNNITYGQFERTDNFPDPISKWSKTFALNYRINNAFTVYGLYSEGIAPNTGLTDGDNDFIEAEETTSKEVGVKFALKQNRITGSISAYMIERKNAIWDFRYAPAPAKWIGSPNPPVGLSQTSDRFDPIPRIGLQTLTYGINVRQTPAFFRNAYAAGNSSIQDPVTLHRTFFINTRNPAGNPIRNQIPGLIGFANRGGTADSRQIFYVKHSDMDVPFNFSYTDASGNLVSNTYTWRQWFETAFFNTAESGDVAGQFDPIDYTREESFFEEWVPGNNPSLDTSTGANVTFADESKGVDFELIVQPAPSLQFLFNYSYTERSAKGAFQMVDFVSLEDGSEWAGTEYDRIVRVFGREAFGIVSEDTNGDGFADRFLDQHGVELSESNPLRPSEATSGIDGLSLFFNPAHQATFWSRYDITSGALRNLGFGFGANYSSSAPTAISIGGDQVGQNLFPTPDTSENWTLNAGIFYKFEAGRTNWRLRLNVNNLLDDRKDVTTVSYFDAFNDREVNKRSEIFRFPRSYRLTATVSF